MSRHPPRSLQVEVADDPATKLNTELINTLASHSQVIVCGEAARRGHQKASAPVLAALRPPHAGRPWEPC